MQYWNYQLMCVWVCNRWSTLTHTDWKWNELNYMKQKVHALQSKMMHLQEPKGLFPSLTRVSVKFFIKTSESSAARWAAVTLLWRHRRSTCQSSSKGNENSYWILIIPLNHMITILKITQGTKSVTYMFLVAESNKSVETLLYF